MLLEHSVVSSQVPIPGAISVKKTETAMVTPALSI